MSGHLDGPPPGPPDPPYIPGDLGAPSAEEFARRRASPEPERNPYRNVDDDWDHAGEAACWDEGFTAGLQKHDGGLWDLAFAAGRQSLCAAFDAVVAERDKANARVTHLSDVLLTAAATASTVRGAERVVLEMGERFPALSADRNSWRRASERLEREKVELRAERDAVIAAGQKLADAQRNQSAAWLTVAPILEAHVYEPNASGHVWNAWTRWGERALERGEAALAAWRSVSGSSEPR